MKIAVKILSKEEYEQLVEEEKTCMVSPFYELYAEHQVVAVEYPNELFKILKYPQVTNAFDEEVFERLNVLLTRDELQQFIFLQGI